MNQSDVVAGIIRFEGADVVNQNIDLYKLAKRSDSECLQREVARLNRQQWIAYPGEPANVYVLPLISVGGTPNRDYAIAGPMQPTPQLQQSPSLLQLLHTFARPLSRCCLLRLAGRRETPDLADASYHAFRRQTIYIPIVTNPDVKFIDKGQEIHLPAGTAWLVGSAQSHAIINASDHDCIYLAVETKLASAEAQPGTTDDNLQREHAGELLIEPHAFEVLTPREIQELTAEILAAVGKSEMPAHARHAFTKAVATFRDRWTACFGRFGHHTAGELAYLDLILYFFVPQVAAKASRWLCRASKGKAAIEVIRSMLQTAPKRTPEPMNLRLFLHKRQLDKRRLNKRQRKLEAANNRPSSVDLACPQFEKPLFIVSAPRAGSTLLFETLALFPALWTIGEESHELIEAIPSLHPAAHGYQSNRLTAVDAPLHLATDLQRRFVQQLQDRSGQLYLELSAQQRPDRVRMLEKTPKNALRIPFLKSVFPEARFLFLYREPGANISSMMEGWRAQRFVPYPAMPGWPHREWNFLLVPGWRSLIDRPIAEIAAYQWQQANATILADLAALPTADWRLVRYNDLVRSPRQTIHRIARFAELQWDDHVEQHVSHSLPASSMTLSEPSAEKWRKNSWQLEPLLAGLQPIVQRVSALDSCQSTSA